MKKALIGLCLASTLLLSSCGASWERTKKDYKADIGGGLVRSVKVYDFISKETVFEYEGKCYLDDGAKPGDFTLICYDKNNESKKVDFVGHGMSIVMIEK